jgi:hypothetical protein
VKDKGYLVSEHDAFQMKTFQLTAFAVKPVPTILRGVKSPSSLRKFKRGKEVK